MLVTSPDTFAVYNVFDLLNVSFNVYPSIPNELKLLFVLLLLTNFTTYILVEPSSACTTILTEGVVSISYSPFPLIILAFKVSFTIPFICTFVAVDGAVYV